MQYEQKSEKMKKVKNSNNKKLDTKKQVDESDKMERRMKEIEDEIKELVSSMEDLGSDFEELHKLYTKKEELSKELDLVMDEWVGLNQ